MSVTISSPIVRTFEEDWAFQEGYYSQVSQILKGNATHFVRIGVADVVTDTKQATDFVVTIAGGDVAVRIRRADKPFRDLTIRSYKRGHRTEIHKIRDGFGRYYLYCWENDDNELNEWILVDLDKVRELDLLENRDEIPNYDGTTKFVSICTRELVANDCILASTKIKNCICRYGR